MFFELFVFKIIIKGIFSTYANQDLVMIIPG